jgi:putative transposase
VLTNDDLLLWFQRLATPAQTRSIIDCIRSSGPSRHVGGGRSNVSGRYPSRKMGVTIQFESHRVELAGVYEMEHDAAVLEYFDQPPSIKLDYASATGKRMGVLHTPDFFVIRDRDAGWEEWKTEEELQRLAERNPNRYCAGAEGRWRCPPGADYAERLGLYYRVRSSAEIEWVYQRNIQFLEDYLRVDSPAISTVSRESAVAHVSATHGLLLEDLLRLNSVPPDDIFAMIAANILYVDLRAAPLAEPSQVEVFTMSEVVSRTKRDSARKPDMFSWGAVHCGSTLTWDCRIWKVVNTGDASVGLLSEDQRLTELPVAAFQSLIRQGRIEVAPSNLEHVSDSAVHQQISRASERDLEFANHRASHISRYLDLGTLPAETDVPARTFYRWLACYRSAEASCRSGFVGLLPKQSQRGNYTPKLPEASRRLMEEFIDLDYETLKQKTKYASWVGLKAACEKQGIRVPSYKTFCVAAARRPTFNQTLKRKGRRAAYQVETFYWDLDQKTPRHGDRPLEIAHLDHTELDIELISQSGKVLGRPWMTLLTDAFSRRILAFYITFDAPSYRSCMMVLRECVRRLGRFPQSLVVDGGPEFGSTYFETLLARYECTKKTRPPAKARFGSVCERLFGTANTRFVHNLLGNTQITRNVRQVTKSVDPKKHAIWPLAGLYDRMCEYLYDVYDTIQHPALGLSPREAYASGLAAAGQRPQRLIAYDQDFLIWTLPTTPKGTAKVSPGRGIKLNHLFYWSDALRDPVIEQQQVPVRYDPFDAGIAYAYVGKRWVQCISEHYSSLRGKSERELMLATTELRRRAQQHAGQFTVTAKKLADFLASVESEEALRAQRLQDREAKSVLTIIEGGLANPDRRDMTLKESGDIDQQDVPDAVNSGIMPGTAASDEIRVFEEY